MQIFSNGDNLREMSNPIFWKKRKNINLSSAEFAHRVVKQNEYVCNGSSYRDILKESCFKRKQMRRTAHSLLQSSQYILIIQKLALRQFNLRRQQKYVLSNLIMKLTVTEQKANMSFYIYKVSYDYISQMTLQDKDNVYDSFYTF